MNTQPLNIKSSIVAILLGITINAQAEITILHPTTVNVTPSQFSVIWETDAPAVPRIAIFQDPEGTNNITSQLEVIINPVQSGDPGIVQEYNQDQYKASARDIQQSLGQYTIQVRGTSPETAYYFKIYSESTTDSGVWPMDLASFAEVITEAENSFLSESSQLLVTVGHLSPVGWLMTAENSATNYRIAARIGDGANDHQAYLNLSNMFAADGRNWTPQGTQLITIDVWSGAGTHFSQDVSIDFTGDFSVSTLRKQLINLSIENNIIMTAPASPHYSTGEAISLQWQDQAESTNAVIDLYFDTDNNGEDGVQIVGGIEEDPDNTGDQYLWNTTGVDDGIYYPYAQMEAGEGPITSYAPAAIAIDRAGTDSDVDLLADLWEQLYFGSLSNDGTQDSDNDGSDDSQEFQDKTDPIHPDIKLMLKRGLNLISLPIIPAFNQADDLLASLGARANSIKYIDATSNLMVTAPGVNFALQSGHGYFIEMTEDAELIVRGALPVSDSLDLQVGTNLIGFRTVPEGYSAFQLLQAIGTATEIASIQRFNYMTGRFDAVVYDQAGVISGQDFPIKRGEGYIVAMKQTVNGFVIP